MSPSVLDQYNGHTNPEGEYHYHSSKRYPYVNGGFHGKVVKRGDQVDGNVARSELLKAATQIFNAADKDRDGKVSKTEWQSAPNTPVGRPPRR